MNPYVLSTFMFSLGLGTFMTFISSNWILAWMGLEINTLAIIPLMAQPHHPRAVESATKYFMTQAAGAAIIMFSSLTNAWTTGVWDINSLTNPIASTMFMMALALKIGLAPTHFWLPEVLQGLDLTTGLILSTWQKLAPFALLIQTAHNIDPLLLTFLGAVSTMVGGWGGLNQTQLRKIMAYSSIAHMGWMIVIIQFSPKIALISLTIYIILTSAMFMIFKTLMIKKLDSMSIIWSNNPILASMAALVLLSLAGLPPLTGFMPKWLILQEMAKQEMLIIATIMALATLISLFFYLRLCYVIMLTIKPDVSNKPSVWRCKQTKMPLPVLLMITMAMLLLPTTPTVLILFT
ncbi:NADH dehydrogenase subunit 2 (mitochondrion) [Puntigrus tetrazona]|uniref:NADH-ubiquinone oxidoreductase chain 2 n=1 Tax=Puntigrus tetrazona TaxID=1606681 RepID=A9QXH1_PUNTE|nr:NADH dehydrogenase subunit 2 [Puntigrus tetrazona]ABX59326.1 NADH dehydrogenase subunit 2 [Puntigrus tetrazona]